jgi:hypothetical protein
MASSAPAGLQLLAQPMPNAPNLKTPLAKNLAEKQRRYEEGVEIMANAEKNYRENESNDEKRTRFELAQAQVADLARNVELAERAFQIAPGNMRRVSAPPGFLTPPPSPPPGPGPTPPPTPSAPPAEPGYPNEATLAKKYTMSPVPIYFNIKNGQFKVTIPRAAGTKGALEICSPSLKGIRDTLIADATSGVRQPVSMYGKLFGRKRGGTRRRGKGYKRRITRHK